MYFFDSVVDDEIEDIEKKSDVEFVSTKPAPPLAVIYTHPGGRGATASSFAVGIAAVVDMLSSGSKVVFKNSTNSHFHAIEPRV